MEGLVSREVSPGDRGRAFGSACAEAVARTVGVYRRLFADAAGLCRDEVLRLGEQVGIAVSAGWPELVDEIEGLAAGAGHDPRELLAINARTELLAGTQARGECSLVARRGTWLAQTWDWHPDLAGAAIAWTVEHAGGRFTTVTEAGVLAKLGCNDAGVACGLNFLTCSEDRRTGGMPIHLLLRLVLERCASASEARALLRDVRTAASSCITVAAGDSLFAAELSPGGTRFVSPADDGWLVHTNHFLLPPASGSDPTPSVHPGTLERRSRLLEAARDGLAPPDALALHDGRLESVCRHDDGAGPWHERRATLLAVWMEPARRLLRVAPGPPCSTPFEVVW
ncbi:C45 family autoproteolytic acyltransferase/hydolase [Solirubrobacter soli]|uniref:C45 family autoproteolytic acyltransferase/hydolase n=1 Tax=Solirubrobacter soli TaxID=363832 RepID=UPI00048947E5|nr:C45 family peptidase [Solirubrobacter soli]